MLPGGPQDAALDPEAWRGRLSSADFDERERAFEALIDAARAARECEDTLAQWANGQDEFAWTCRLALRELRRSPRAFGSLRPHVHSGRTFSVPFDFDEWREDMEDMESSLGLFFDDQAGNAFSFGPGAGRGRLDELFSNRVERGESISLSVTPDGVKCTIRSKADGEDQVQEFEAESLEALLEAHPELREHGLSEATGVIRLEPFALDTFGGDPQRWPGASPRARLGGAAPRTDVLGVYVTPLADKAGEGGGGLRIDAIEPGTIAAEMGLEAGQTLIELAGRTMDRTEDVSAALRERDSAEVLEAVVLDAQGERRTLQWKPTRKRVWHTPGRVREL